MKRDVKLNQVRLNDGFFSQLQNKVIDMVIPYQEKILRDEIEGAEKSHAITNFKIAAGLEEGQFYGMVFQDSDVAKWIEGAAASLTVRPDKALEKRIDNIIEIIEKAQQPDGYLDTYFIIKEPEGRWKNLLEGHELYCAGHMIEAGVTYFEATGKDRLLKVCERLADHIDCTFRINGHEGYPGHPEIELALMRLYGATGKENYMLLAKHFLDARGVDREFFDREEKQRSFKIWGMDPKNLTYNQSHQPVRQQRQAVGHAVRALYLYEAMAEVAEACNDKELKEACASLWNDIVEKKMFVTGGVGSDGSMEAFSKEYYLPNDMAYNETCAQIAMMFFSKKMLDMGRHPNGKYADIMELLIYNSTISGMQYDGSRFFYVNPLEVNPEISGKVFGHMHVLPQRPKWYACACCPPNLVRMISSLGKYAFSQDEGCLYSNLFIGADADFKLCNVKVETAYPWKGQVKYTIQPKADEFTFAFHIPAHIKAIKICMDQKQVQPEIKDGFAYFKINHKTIIEAHFELPVRKLYASEKIMDDHMKVALKRGPIVYCFEEADNKEQLFNVKLCDNLDTHEICATDLNEPVIISNDSTVTAEGLKQVVCLRVKGEKRIVDTKPSELYTDAVPSYKEVTLTAVPYFLWGNRNCGAMRVWVNG